MGKENRQIIQLDKLQFERKNIKENITIIKNALDSSINAIAISNFEGKLIYVNPAFLRMWGYEDDKDILGRFAVDFWQIRDLANKVLKETQKKGSWFGELVAQKRDGKNLSVQVSTSLIRNEVDEVYGIIASFVDITKQKKVEEALQKSEKRFQDVALCSADWIWEIDREVRYTFASGKVKEILGYEASELIGKTPFDLMPKKEAKDIGEVFNKISFEKKPIVDLENWNQTKHGKKVCLLTNGIPILDENGNLTGYRGVDKDITEQKKNEEELVKYRHDLEELVKKRTIELENINEELDSVINSASEIIIAFNSNNKVTSWNKSVELLTGYKQKEIIGKDMSHLNIFDNPEDLNDIKKICLNGSHYKHPLKTKNVLNTKSGGRIIVRFSISTIKDKKGQYKGCLFIGKDVTSDPDVHGKLLMGSSYLVSEKTSKSTITLFTNLTNQNNKGLFITRGNPNIIRNTVSFLNAEAVLFKQNSANGFENIIDLEGLKTKIKNFTKENKNSVIVVDRVDYLITNFSFEEFAKALYQITDMISENNALLLFHIDPELLDARQMAIITNELQLLPSQKIEDIQLKDEIFDILRFINEQNQKNVTVSFKKVSKEFSIVDKTTTKRLRILEDEGLIFVKKLGRIKSLNVSEKGKTLLNKRKIV